MFRMRKQTILYTSLVVWETGTGLFLPAAAQKSHQTSMATMQEAQLFVLNICRFTRMLF